MQYLCRRYGFAGVVVRVCCSDRAHQWEILNSGFVCLARAAQHAVRLEHYLVGHAIVEQRLRLTRDERVVFTLTDSWLYGSVLQLAQVIDSEVGHSERSQLPLSMYNKSLTFTFVTVLLCTVCVRVCTLTGRH